jgi:ribosomal protein L7/L12
MTDYDSNNLCLLRKVTKYFKVTTPTSLKSFEISYEKCDITEYVKVNQQTFEEQTLLTLGSPDKVSFEFKRGCLRKKVNVDTKVEQVSRREYLKKTGGSILEWSDNYLYDIVMDDVGRDMVATIKAVKNIVNCSVKEAKNLVDKVASGHDTILKRNLSETNVKACLETLKKAGAYGYVKLSQNQPTVELLENKEKDAELLESVSEIQESANVENGVFEESSSKGKKSKKKKGINLPLIIMTVLCIGLIGLLVYVYLKMLM